MPSTSEGFAESAGGGGHVRTRHLNPPVRTSQTLPFVYLTQKNQQTEGFSSLLLLFRAIKGVSGATERRGCGVCRDLTRKKLGPGAFPHAAPAPRRDLGWQAPSTTPVRATLFAWGACPRPSPFPRPLPIFHFNL